MVYKEEQRNLFSVSRDYVLCHCISSDFALSEGIAREFADKGVKAELRRKYIENYWKNDGDMLVTYSTGFGAELNLVTKEKYWNKPTLETIRQALVLAKEFIVCHPYMSKIAMPKLVCDSDELQWEDVSKLIKDIFKDIDIEILICI